MITSTLFSGFAIIIQKEAKRSDKSEKPKYNGYQKKGAPTSMDGEYATCEWSQCQTPLYRRN